MKRVVIAAAAACLVAAAGCSSSAKYVSPVKDQAQMEQDLAECDWEASRATGNLTKGDDRTDRVAELVDKCMKAKGYKAK